MDEVGLALDSWPALVFLVLLEDPGNQTSFLGDASARRRCAAAAAAAAHLPARPLALVGPVARPVSPRRSLSSPLHTRKAQSACGTGAAGHSRSLLGRPGQGRQRADGLLDWPNAMR